MEIQKVKDLLYVLEKLNFSKAEINFEKNSITLEKFTNKEISVDKDITELKEHQVKQYENDEGIQCIKSPIVGVFHNSKSAGSEICVKIGDTVKKGDVIGIIEAMKLMNEIESPYTGEVVDISVENNDVVGYGDILMKIKVD